MTYPVPVERDPAASQDGPGLAPEGTQPLVTIAALYGAGGSVIGPRVAARLGVAFMGRDIPEMAARRSGEPLEAVDAVAEGPHPGANRLTARLARAPIIGAAATRVSAEPLEATERRLRSCIEAFLADAATRGGVLLGHGGMVVLRSVPERCTSYSAARSRSGSARPWRCIMWSGRWQRNANRSRTGPGSATSVEPTGPTAWTPAGTT